jgi:hypothetical protein
MYLVWLVTVESGHGGGDDRWRGEGDVEIRGEGGKLGDLT